MPISIFDAGYDPLQLAQALGEARAGLLVQLRAGRCFYADTTPREQSTTGRPPRHGHTFACADPTIQATWLPPSDEYTVTDAQYGSVRVRA